MIVDVAKRVRELERTVEAQAARIAELESVAHAPVTPIVSAEEFDALQGRVAKLEAAERRAPEPARRAKKKGKRSKVLTHGAT